MQPKQENSRDFLSHKLFGLAYLPAVGLPGRRQEHSFRCQDTALAQGEAYKLKTLNSLSLSLSACLLFCQKFQ